MFKNHPLLLSKIKMFSWRLALLAGFLLLFLIIYLDSQVKNEFKQQAWNIPAKVYARPLSFSLAKRLTLADLKSELALLGYRQTIKAVKPGQFEQYHNTLVIRTREFKFWDGTQPEQTLEVTIEDGKISQLKDFASRKAVNFLRLDPLPLGSIQAGNLEDRQLIKLQQLPPHFVSALLNTEDKNFYSHWGLSISGIARALWQNVSTGKVRQGGSTLTQQLMKNHFLSQKRSWWRKFREAIMALLTEIHYDKDTILEAYLNEVYLGQGNRSGIYGFARASEFYFDQPLEKLDLSQVALLVGLVNGPSLFNPRKNPERARQRRSLVLSQLLANGLITDADYRDAQAKTLQVVAKPQTKTSRVPAFLSAVKSELRQAYSLSTLHSAGLRLFTTLDPLLQKKAEDALSRRVKQIEKNMAENTPALQGAVIVSDIKTGDILAMVGDRNPNFIGFNRATDAYRQTGSVIKPFVYLAALSRNRQFNLLSPLSDESFSLKGSDNSLWTPQNYDRQTHGEVQLKDALIHSYNLATARLALAVGMDEVVDTIQAAGFERDLPAFPSIALGAKEMSPVEVLKLYQVLANDGVAVTPTGLIAVQDHQGNLLQRYRRTASLKFEPEAVFLIKYLLTQVVEQGTAKAIGETFSGQNYAGKTGTTNDLRDSWYVGFGEERLGVVWLGRDDNRPGNLTGATGALTVWRDLFKQLQEPGVDLVIPESLVWAFPSAGIFSFLKQCEENEKIPFYPEQVPANYKACD